MSQSQISRAKSLGQETVDEKRFIKDAQISKSISQDSECRSRGRYRWFAEFMVRGIHFEKEEIVSEWFDSKDEARKNAYSDAQKEVNNYPGSQGKIRKLAVEREGEEEDITELPLP